ncbi:MAG: hypothetical protein IPL84_11200 [Chitinophagaceae bacterium]|nr:hypothetical protein [Chitinophagaceae bacterium]
MEALHSNLQREVMDRFEFDSIYHAQMIIDRYYKWYNEKEGMVHYPEKHPKPYGTSILIRFPRITKKLLNYL